MHYFELNGIINLDIRLIDTGEIAIATPKCERGTNSAKVTGLYGRNSGKQQFAPKKKIFQVQKTERMNFHALLKGKNRN